MPQKMEIGCKLIIQTVCLLISVLLFNEYLIYYIVQSTCNYAELNSTLKDRTIKSSNDDVITAMVLADTHLLGSRNGHWFDKLRREWQMYRSFQTAVTLHKPDLVFVLGDITDEGLFCGEEEFDYYIRRFQSLFHVPEETKLYVVVGNHDIGFHYRITPYLNDRFVEGFNSPGIRRISIKGNHFVLINSMALHGDGCFLCKPAERELNRLERIFKCSKAEDLSCENITKLSQFSRPILLQHFPLYRPSDMVCNEPDSAPMPLKSEQFKERRECLSKESTTRLLKQLNPRLAVSGHTHHGCLVPLASGEGLEITVPSFSWRNKNNPTYSLLKVSPNNYSWSRCHMPEESTVINVYIVSVVFITLWTGYTIFKKLRRKKYKYI